MITLQAKWQKGTGGNKAGAVLQIPKNFQIITWWTDSGKITRDDPNILGLYQAEPGHYLASFSGTGTQNMRNPITLRVLLRAPKTTGTWVLKTALAGQEKSGWQAQDPKGVTAFAKIKTPPYIAPVAVTPNLPAQDFRTVYEGLPALDGDGWPDLAAAFYAQGVVVFHNERTGFRTFGEACSGALPQAPRQGFQGSHTVGSTNSAWTLSKAPGGASFFLTLGISRSHLGGRPILPFSLAPLGAPGCFLRAAPVLFFPGKAGASGSAVFPIPIPNQAALHGALIYGQFLVSAPKANRMGLILTEGGALRIR